MDIKTIRTEYHLSQRQVAELTGVPMRTLQSWELGERKCPEYVEKMICEKIEFSYSVKRFQVTTRDSEGNYSDQMIQALNAEQAIEFLGVNRKEVVDVAMFFDEYYCY